MTHITGGTRTGNARWAAFLRSGLDQYASRRNNAMLRCAAAAGRPWGTSLHLLCCRPGA